MEPDDIIEFRPSVVFDTPSALWFLAMTGFFLVTVQSRRNPLDDLLFAHNSTGGLKVVLQLLQSRDSGYLKAFISLKVAPSRTLAAFAAAYFARTLLDSTSYRHFLLLLAPLYISLISFKLWKLASRTLQLNTSVVRVYRRGPAQKPLPYQTVALPGVGQFNISQVCFKPKEAPARDEWLGRVLHSNLATVLEKGVHRIYRFLIWNDGAETWVVRRLASGRILYLDMECRPGRQQESCDGSCLLKEPGNPDLYLENCPVPGCQSPEFPTLEHIHAHFLAPTYFCGFQHCPRNTINYAFYSEAGCKKHLQEQDHSWNKERRPSLQSVSAQSSFQQKLSQQAK